MDSSEYPSTPSDEAAADKSGLMAQLEPWLEFISSGAAGGVVLICASAFALICANSALEVPYNKLLHLHLAITLQGSGIDWDLNEWVNDGLMTVFFLLVGLEIRREMTHGQLASLSKLAGPGFAAIGGMVVPALIFMAFNIADPGVLRGWAIPMATDIAFSLAILRVLGSRVPVAMKIFLTALAIIDDLGAIIVIALFYTENLNPVMLAWAAGLCVAMWALGRAGMRALPPYILGGVLLWYLVMRSGVHATLAGVALAFVVPMAREPKTPMARDPKTQYCPAEALEHMIGNWVAYFIMPLFGFANAGLSLDHLPAGVATSKLVLGVVLGLVVGKQIGVFGATWLGLRSGIAKLPGRMNSGQLYAVSVLCGIGFTMSFFIGDLAFRGLPREDEVRLAILVGSAVSAVFGLGVLALVTRRHAPQPG
jgi:Na+:H+ antiporter, NhaA family